MSHQIGPQLPPELAEKLDQANSTSSKEDEDGPLRPPQQEDSNEEDAYGPALPPDMLLLPKSNHSSTTTPNNQMGTLKKGAASATQKIKGPTPLPNKYDERFSDNDDDDDDDEDIVGPVEPKDQPEKEFERNFFDFKRKEYYDHAAASAGSSRRREEWMTELPSKLKSYGLGARQFKKIDTGGIDDDGSEWTKDPLNPRSGSKSGRKDKDDSSNHLKSEHEKKREKRFEEKVEKCNKEKRRGDESLMEIHHKKLKKQKIDDDQMEKKASSKGSTMKERRPFDREKDLRIVDPAKIMSNRGLVEKASELTNRFSHSSQQKFL